MTAYCSDHCRICDSVVVHFDEVEVPGPRIGDGSRAVGGDPGFKILLLAECQRCNHRWTQAVTSAPAAASVRTETLQLSSQAPITSPRLPVQAEVASAA